MNSYPTYIKRLGFILLLCLFTLHAPAQSLEKNVEERLENFFTGYQTGYAEIGTCALERFDIDHQKKTLHVYANDAFGYQPFTEANVKAIYRTLTQSLPGPVNYYRVTLYADGQPIENLIPNAYRGKAKDKSRLYEDISYKGDAWTENLSRPFRVTQGLEGRHIALWQSHGRFYQNKTGEWRWQRPRLFGTCEDLYTRSIVVPYLIPMLENAGAVVFTPRERDEQTHEVIVDNNTCTPGSRYLEVNYKRKCVWQDAPTPGFAQKQTTYTDGQNPFRDGTARFIPTHKKPEKAFAEWIPRIPEKGRYAVYVSYQSLPESVTDAKYLVFHNGGVTEFRVNQRIGGGTWTYLGTFEFDAGMNDYGMVALSNESAQDGVVCADAVRFGGGMGNIARGGHVSGMPRWAEGARYWAQWAGMPYSVYSKSEGENDYNDDINTRSLMLNHLSGGSVFNPHEKGLGIPFELSFALHSDAGFKADDTFVGSLGIYTTRFNDGKLASGISRYASRDLADMLLTGLQRDISSRFGIRWTRRGMWNRNYSETRLPAVPSVILETLSHQNFADLKMGYDPAFKFTVARSVYKTMLKYLATMHDERYTVQPLPVTHFAIDEGKQENTFRLRWTPAEDPLEPTARAEGYVVYTRVGRGGFDNGTYVREPHYTFRAEPGIVYSFRVTAVNRGGESFPSETLAAYRAKHSRGTVLIVNGFRRTSAPAAIETDTRQGFDLYSDPGIPYLGTTAFCGYQQSFDRSRIGVETEGGLGYSGSELEGKRIAGNTFDYPFIHGKAIQQAGGWSFVSCSAETLETGSTDLTPYPVVDLIRGAEDRPLSPAAERALTAYCEAGGNLLVSGTYTGSRTGSETFLRNVLHCTYGGSLRHSSADEVYGTALRFRIARRADAGTYAVPSPESLTPVAGAFTAYLYADTNAGAAVAYPGTYRALTLGFPFECIREENARARLMQSILGFLCPR